jgi:hypothetical protein
MQLSFVGVAINIILSMVTVPLEMGDRMTTSRRSRSHVQRLYRRLVSSIQTQEEENYLARSIHCFIENYSAFSLTFGSKWPNSTWM